MRAEVGPWLIDRVLGRGAQGVVWSCEHRVTGRAGAMKGFLPGGARAEAWRDEARAVAGLVHPGIVWVHDIGNLDADTAAILQVPPDCPWMVMDRADSSLFDRPPQTLGEVLDAVDQVLDALAHVHARDLLHLDLKPANLLRFGDQVRLADFGVARWIRDPQLAGRIHGTPLFMAPEQIQEGPAGIGPWSDVYALGWVTWSLISGHPWAGRNLHAVLMAQLWEEPTPPGPPPLAAWLRRCVAKHPEKRFRTAADARHALASLRVDIDVDRPVGETAVAERATTFDLHDLERPVLRRPAGALTTLDGLDEPAMLDVGPPPMPDDWRFIPEHRPPPLPQVGLGLFQLRAVPLVGREELRDALWDALRHVHEGGHEVLALRGPSGMGKTALAEWLVTSARQLAVADGWVARGPSQPGAADPTADLVADGLSRSVELPVELDEHARAVLDALGRRTDDPVPLRPKEVVATLRTWLTAIAAERPLVLAIDDAHHAEPLLQVLADVGAIPGLLVLLTVQEEAAAERAGFEPLLRQLGARPLVVRALPQADRRQMVTRLLGLSDDLTGALLRRTDGHPLFAVQLLQDWIDRGVLAHTGHGFDVVSGADLPLPDGLWATWRDRVDRLVRNDAERIALEQAAVLATFAPVVDPAEWRGPHDLRERLLNARLVDATPRGGLRFVHGMLREALVQDADAAGRLPRHHGTVADLVQEPERRGRHLYAAGRYLEAVAPLTQAARSQLNRDTERAAELLEMAGRGVHAATPDEDHVAYAIARASLALTQSKPALAADMLNITVPRASTPRLACALHARRTFLAVRQRRTSIARRCVDALSAAAEGVPDLQAVAARWQAEVHLIESQPAAAREALEPWLDQFHSPSLDEGDAWFTWASIARVEGNQVEAQRGFEKALSVYEALGVATPKIAALGGLADTLRYQGRLDEAREAAAAMVRLGRSRDPQAALFGAVTLAGIDVSERNMSLAKARIDALLAGDQPQPAITLTVLALRLAYHAHVGPDEAVRGDLDALDAQLLDTTMPVYELDVLLALEQAAGDLEAAGSPHAPRARKLADDHRVGLHGA